MRFSHRWRRLSLSEKEFIINCMRFCYDRIKTPDLDETYEFNETKAGELVGEYLEEHHKTYGEVEFITLAEEQEWYKYLEAI